MWDPPSHAECSGSLQKLDENPDGFYQNLEISTMESPKIFLTTKQVAKMLGYSEKAVRCELRIRGLEPIIMGTRKFKYHVEQVNKFAESLWEMAEKSKRQEVAPRVNSFRGSSGVIPFRGESGRVRKRKAEEGDVR